MNNFKKDIRYKTHSQKGGGGGLSDINTAAAMHGNVQNNISNNSGGAIQFDSFVNDKVKKLTTALYMVTSFLSDNEPIKWKLRERAVALMSDIVNVRMHTTSESENIFAGLVVTIKEIVSLLEVAAAAKLISEMNFTILKREYGALEETLVSPSFEEHRRGQIVFDEGFFDTTHTLPEPEVNDAPAVSVQSPVAPQSVQVSSVSRGGKRRVLGHAAIKDIKDKKTDVAATANKERREAKRSRREMILALFKENKEKELTIKDISNKITDCSEKTIQRELTALVLEGKVKKKGERRWSRYSLR